MSDGAALRVLTEPLGGSPLSRAIQARALAAPLQPWWPATADDWRAHVSRVRASADARWLESLRPAIQPSGPAEQRLARAAAEGVVITTGQQAGLFGGPLYTLSKALSALSLADAIERALGIPAAPLFWAATDDADFLEASSAYVADSEGLTRLALEDAPPAGTPMARAPLGDTSALLRRLHRACGSASHGRYFELARAAFSGPRTIGDAYVALLRELLAPLGVAVLDSSHTVVRARSAPLVQRAMERAAAVGTALGARGGALRDAGFEPQVDDGRGLSLVFALDGAIKRRLPIDEAMRSGGAGAGYSPNVLLRPVVERFLLPTAGYVAGPGELAYFAQVGAVAEALEAATPVAVPRWSGTVLEPFTQRALARLGIEPAEAAEIHALERRLARSAMPPAVGEAMTRLEQRVAASLDELDAAARATRLVPPEVIDGLRRAFEHRRVRAERRLVAAVKRREEQVRRDLQLVSAALYPLGQRQERVLNFIPMLARNGEPLLDAMRAEADRHAYALIGAPRAHPVTTR